MIEQTHDNGKPLMDILITGGIGALLAAALCIALYLFTHPVREEDDPEENE